MHGENTMTIPAELRSAAQNGVVTSAEGVFDYTKGKSQEAVNADIDSTLALHQSEINALDSQNYVTVDTYAELPEEGTADTIYRVANWDDTQVVTNAYAEYGWNGSQYKLLDVKNPGIDDVPTAGSDNLVKSGGTFKNKSIIFLSKILKSHVSDSLNTGEYGYNIGLNNIVYKDANGTNRVYDVLDNTNYVYMGVTFVKGTDTLKIVCKNEIIQVNSISGIPTGSPEGFYFVDSTNKIAFVSGTSESSPTQDILRTDIVDGALLSYNENLYIFNGALKKLYYDENVNIAVPYNEYVDFDIYNGTITIPANSIIKFKDYYKILSSDVVISYTGVTKGTMLYDRSTETFSVQQLSLSVAQDKDVIFTFDGVIGTFGCSLAKSDYTINSYPATYVDEKLRNVGVNVNFNDNQYVTTGSNIGDTVNMSVESNVGFCYASLQVKAGDVYRVVADGGNAPKGLVVTNKEGIISKVNTNFNGIVVIKEDGFLIVNAKKNMEYYFIDYNDDNTLVLNTVQYQLLQTPNRGEYAYNTSDNTVAYCTVINGTRIILSVQSYRSYSYLGVLLKLEDGSLKPIFSPSNIIPVLSIYSRGGDAGYYYSPTVKQICLVGSPTGGNVPVIRKNIIDGVIIRYNNNLYVSENGLLQEIDIPSLADFNIDNSLRNLTGWAQEFPYDGTVLLTKIYEVFDELVENYPNYVKKVDLLTYLSTEMAALGVNDYPEYANGVETAGTYLVTPEYRTYMYIFGEIASESDLWANLTANKKKDVLMIGGTHGNEMISQVNLYTFAKQLCENVPNDKNYFTLRNSCTFYIVPILNGYGLYHKTRTNANGVDLNRNYDCLDGFVESGDGTINYTGPSAFSEFETKLVKCLTEKLNPSVCVDHHSYAGGELNRYQIYYGEISNIIVERALYKSAVDISQCLQKHYPAYYGTSGKILNDRAGFFNICDCSDSQMTSSWWYCMKHIVNSCTIEVSHVINYNNGVPVVVPTMIPSDEIYQIDEYILRVSLIRVLQNVFRIKYLS